VKTNKQSETKRSLVYTFCSHQLSVPKMFTVTLWVSRSVCGDMTTERRNTLTKNLEIRVFLKANKCHLA